MCGRDWMPVAPPVVGRLLAHAFGRIALQCQRCLDHHRALVRLSRVGIGKAANMPTSARALWISRLLPSLVKAALRHRYRSQTRLA